MDQEFWMHWDQPADYDGWEQGDAPFHCLCKWCKKEITMTPTDDGWRPREGGKLHVCEARIKSQQKAMIAQMPDMSLPECQFCQTNMVWRRGDPDYEDTWSPHFFLSCPKCGSCGPRVESGHEDFRRLMKITK